MTIEKMRTENGYINYNEKTYVLIRQAYINGTVEDPYYLAIAICPEEGVEEDGLYNVYQITWYPRQDWLDSDREDEGWACDWEIPDDVEITGSGYDMNDDRVI